MNITKYGHSCILVEEGEARILFDPGSYSKLPEGLADIDAVLITHSHPDHIVPENLQNLLKHNSKALVYTNTEVGQLLLDNGIPFQLLEQGAQIEVRGITVEAFGNDHAMIHPDIPLAQNTCYFIADRLFHPGDSLTIPPKQVEILALPVVAPWEKISETLDYIAAVKPQVCLPIHDGFLTDGGPYYYMSEMWCKKFNVEFAALPYGESRSF